jgi:HEPN domain-containing protein
MPDPDALRYLRIAQDDLLEAQRMVQLSGLRDSSIGFRLQQSCEKALKSWIHAKGGMAPFTHDLVALMDWDDTVEISSPDWPLLLSVTASLLEQVKGEL